ncbi:MAG: hypothetical protein ACHQ01_10080 [Candidatus Limnocylindrales bacterium]
MSSSSSRAVRGALALAVLSVVAVACSGSSSGSPTGGGGLGTSQPPVVIAGTPSSAPAGAGSAGVVSGHVGDTLTVTMLGGDKADVTLVKVVDPATVTDANNAAPAGARWVGLEVTTVDHSSGASGDQVLVDGIGSDGQPLTTDAVFQGSSHEIGAFTECTSMGSFMETDQANTICPAFLVPTGVTLASVGAKVGGAEIAETTAVDQVSWKVP